ncbi:ABC transporter permease [Thiospirochaeta perfilievii]|uniref:ABC transporter permease n=1 Tax=Thiospirochaeta perfilievii TaxID=252967 RepID=A0A5C1QIY8_9SPIO|nr:ABC transporter permease [Thiospirochaeta perfilievii]QEN06142.1 ABC transporter permease [Thiospirochaeta perfilievii]
MDIILNLFPYAVAFTIPLLITSLGGLFSERSGVVNIGLEGLMVVGSFASAISINIYENFMPQTPAIWLGLLTAMILGGIFSLLHAFASINLNANQVISGTAINMIAGALTIFVARSFTGSGNIRITMGFNRWSIPLLKDIPLLGKMFFTNTYPSTWLVIIIVIASWFVIYKTAFGLRLRACGEHPQAADAAGIKVHNIRYLGVIISGAFAGLGGAIILVTYSGEFNGSVAGLGFLALAALIFGQWKPLGIVGATFFFGFASTVANVSQAVPALAQIPGIILKVFPYVMTLIALILFSKSSSAPRAAGEPFDSGKR